MTNIREDITTSGIETLPTVTTGNGAIYNLNGQRTDKPAKGIYILNGKKYIAR